RPIVGLPFGFDTVSFQHCRYPGCSETAEGFTGLIAEHKALVFLRFSCRVQVQPIEHLSKTQRTDRNRSTPTVLGGLGTQDDQLAFEVNVAEPHRQHFALTHPSIERGDDHRTQEWW